MDFILQWMTKAQFACVAAEEGTQGSEGIHTVYTQPGTVEAFRKTGKFPDGAILIKELFSTTTEEMTTGTVSRADKTSGWFVMIKDATNRYPDNKLWGAGWGWAYFDAKDRINTTTTDYQANCLGCHVPVEDQDWVYVQGYPVLWKIVSGRIPKYVNFMRTTVNSSCKIDELVNELLCCKRFFVLQ